MMTISPSVLLYISTSYVEVENFKHLLTSPYFYHHMNTLDNYFATTRSIRKFKFDTTESMSAFSYATKMCRRQGGGGRGKERGRNEILLKVPLKRCHYARNALRTLWLSQFPFWIRVGSGWQFLYLLQSQFLAGHFCYFLVFCGEHKRRRKGKKRGRHRILLEALKWCHALRIMWFSLFPFRMRAG